MRIVVAECQVDYTGRLSAHLPRAPRLILVKADGSVMIHADGGSYKPLNWMVAPCHFSVATPSPEQAAEGIETIWQVQNEKTDDRLVISIFEFRLDEDVNLGLDPGLVKDGVESDLQRLLAEQLHLIDGGMQLVRREFPTPVGPVDIMARYDAGTSAEPDQPRHVAVEIKRRAGIDAVEQLTRYLDFLNRDPLLRPVQGVLAAQTIAPQARVLATDRNIDCVVLDYDAMRGLDDPSNRLF